MGRIVMTIEIHSAYVETSVRVYGNHGLEYTEYSYAGATIPNALFASSDRYDMLDSMEYLTSDADYDVNELYLPMFRRYFRLVLEFPNATNMDFIVAEARDTRAGQSSQDLRGVFGDAKYSRPILRNLFEMLARKDVAGLTRMIEALRHAS